MRVLLADDEWSVRSALRLLLEQEIDICVVGEVSQAEQLLSALETAHPDVLILDWDLPGFESGEGCCCPPRADAGLKVIATSGRPGARARAIAWGADGFISKTDPPECVLAILHALAVPSSEEGTGQPPCPGPEPLGGEGGDGVGYRSFVP